MGSLSNYATTKMVGHVFKSAYTPVAAHFLALCTAAPTVASTGATIVEADYDGYARYAFSGNAVFGSAASRKIVQNGLIELSQAAGVSTSDIVAWAILDAASNGNVLAFGGFNSPWNVVAGNTPKIPANEIEISIGASGGAGFVDYTAHKLLDLMFRNVAWASPSASIHFGLSTATLTDASTGGTEPVGNGYAREPVPAASIVAPDLGVTTNSAAITFDTPTGSWGLCVALIVMDALTGGNLLAYDNDNIVDQTPVADDTVQIAVGAFTVDLD